VCVGGGEGGEVCVRQRMNVSQVLSGFQGLRTQRQPVCVCFPCASGWCSPSLCVCCPTHTPAIPRHRMPCESPSGAAAAAHSGAFLPHHCRTLCQTAGTRCCKLVHQAPFNIPVPSPPPPPTPSPLKIYTHTRAAMNPPVDPLLPCPVLVLSRGVLCCAASVVCALTCAHPHSHACDGVRALQLNSAGGQTHGATHNLEQQQQG